MKPVNGLTPPELLRELLDALGYEFRLLPPAFPNSVLLGLFDPDGVQIGDARGYATEVTREQLETAAIKYAITQGLLPNWPDDLGAAFALCVQVLDMLNAHLFHTGQVSRRFVFMVEHDSVSFYNALLENRVEEGRDALAMARLALAVLREREVSDD